MHGPTLAAGDVGPRFLKVGNIDRYPADELEAWSAESVRSSLAS